MTHLRYPGQSFFSKAARLLSVELRIVVRVNSHAASHATRLSNLCILSLLCVSDTAQSIDRFRGSVRSLFQTSDIFLRLMIIVALMHNVFGACSRAERVSVNG